jgi:hypothetical protein
MYCPELCDTIHYYLPDFVQWRYITLTDGHMHRLAIDNDTLIIAHHLNPSEMTQWATKHRLLSGKSVGLMLMSDETNNNVWIYGAFDYVLRSFYFEKLNAAPVEHYVRALGNLSCGTGPVWDPNPSDTKENMLPWLGIHYVFQQGLPNNAVSGHFSKFSIWPSSDRPRNCTWTGSLRADRQEMVDGMNPPFCDIDVQDVFPGHIGPFEYGHVRFGQSVFGLNPNGNNPECLRTIEMLSHGTIPVHIDSTYLHKTFRTVPGIIAKNWTEAKQRMDGLLSGPPAVLNALQNECLDWYFDHATCVRKDLEIILSIAMSKPATTTAPTLPTMTPTFEPTSAPTEPTQIPTVEPTLLPTGPTLLPTNKPTEATFAPTIKPTAGAQP